VSFFEGQSFFSSLLSVLKIKSPTIVDTQFNATVFYQLVEEMRERSYKGLRVAEEAVEQGAKKVIELKDPTRQEYQQILQEPIKKLRERYRQATRFNFLDSVADLDLIVLSKELDGSLVSSDEGVIRWGRVFGIKEIPPASFKDELLSL
jgi:RNA ligase partner protein